MHQRQLLGAAGEDRAARFLTARGMEVVQRNWRTSLEGVRGELDLILRDGPVLAVVEVRTRRGEVAGTAAESVGWDKRRRLRRLAALYLQANPHHGPVRGDVVTLQVVDDVDADDTLIRHLRGVW